MKVNVCQHCNARNTLKSTECGNCGEDITAIAKFKTNAKTTIINIIILVVVMGLGLLYLELTSAS